MIRLRHWHPLAFALVPILYFAGKNLNVVSGTDVALAAGATLAIAVALVLLGAALTRDAEKSSAVLSVFIIAFFTAGDTYEPLYKAGVGGVGAIVTLQWVIALALTGAVGVLVWRSPAAREKVGIVLGGMGVVLVLMVGWRLVQPDQLQALVQSPEGPPASHAGVVAAEGPERPDIYYIIADSYPRRDALARYHAFDNGEFIDDLRSRGFYVAERSWANYPKTYLCLASSLGMRYVNDITDRIRDTREAKTAARDRRPLYALIHAPEVARRLQAHGYRYATVLSNWGGSNASKSADVKYAISPLFQNEFFGLLFNRSLLSAFLPTLADLHRFTIEKAKALPALEGPTFSFVHLLLPHPPYVFDEAGNVVRDHPLHGRLGREDYWLMRDAYVAQLKYTNRVLREIVDTILARSKTRPIIVIQGDHGSAVTQFDGTRELDAPQPEERLAILNAYLVPDAVRAKLYPTISPVNSFRAILSAQFGEDLPLLPDQSWFGTSADPYVLTDVTARLASGP